MDEAAHDDAAVARNGTELSFLADLLRSRPHLMVWPHADADGTHWLCVSRDFVTGGAIEATLRVDFDGHGLRGGWSPACLNWDDGVRAKDAGIDTSPPAGLTVDTTDPVVAAEAAGRWFDEHERQWACA